MTFSILTCVWSRDIHIRSRRSIRLTWVEGWYLGLGGILNMYVSKQTRSEIPKEATVTDYVHEMPSDMGYQHGTWIYDLIVYSHSLHKNSYKPVYLIKCQFQWQQTFSPSACFRMETLSHVQRFLNDTPKYFISGMVKVVRKIHIG